MKRYLGLILLGLVCGACTPSGMAGADLGVTQDQSVMPDQTSSTALSLVAGAPGGSGNSDDTAEAARFNVIWGVVADGAGNLYVADQFNRTIRKVVVATGVVTTLAGTAAMAGSTDGIGAAARFDLPTTVAADGAGNLYVADVLDNTIRKVVVATGAVTTLAGTAGVSGSSDGIGALASFNSPSGMAVDGAGNLYVADNRNFTIRKVVVATGAVTTLAGTPGMSGFMDGAGAAARFGDPEGIVLDGAGNLYVADGGAQTIRKVVVATGVVNTLAGTAAMAGSTDGIGAAARFNTPWGLALDGAGNLYIVEKGNQTIRKMVLAMAAVTTLAGTPGMTGSADGTGAAARFNYPNGMTGDGAGNLYVADTGNYNIRKVVAATGAVTTLAGTAPMAGSADGSGAAARFNDPSGVAADGAGNLYVADAMNNTIRKVALATGAVTTLAGTAGVPGGADGLGAAARFYIPTGLALDGAGNLYIADAMNNTIRKVALATGAVTTLAGTAGAGGGRDGMGNAARFLYPTSVASDGAGNLYIADTKNNTIRKVVVATAAVTTLAGTAGMTGSADGTGAAASFNGPRGVAVDGAGNLYVADVGNATIRKVVVDTGAVTTLAGTAGMFGATDGIGAAARFAVPIGVALDGAANLYVTDDGNGVIRKVRVSNGAVITVAGIVGQHGVKLGRPPAKLNLPVGVAVLPTGELIITDENSVLLAR